MSYNNTINFKWQIFYENVAILGMQGDGKTTICRQLLDDIPDVPRIIWASQRPKEHYEGYGDFVNNIDELGRGFFVYTGEYTEKNFIKFLNKVHSLHDILIVIDDAHEWCSKQFLPPEWKNLILSGRNRGIHTIFLSPFPNSLHNTILGSCAHYYCFRFTLKSHIEWVKENVFGDQAWILLDRNKRLKDDPSFPDQLPKRSYLYRNMNETENQLMVYGENDQTQTIIAETEEKEVIERNNSDMPDSGSDQLSRVHEEKEKPEIQQNEESKPAFNTKT